MRLLSGLIDLGRVLSAYHDYVQRGWLDRLADGLFLRPSEMSDPGKPLDWQIVAASMHKIMLINFYVGGMTALTLHGLAHYLPMSQIERVLFYAAKLSGWLGKIEIDAVFEKRTLKLFSDPNLSVEPLTGGGLSFGGSDISTRARRARSARRTARGCWF